MTVLILVALIAGVAYVIAAGRGRDEALEQVLDRPTPPSSSTSRAPAERLERDFSVGLFSAQARPDQEGAE